MAGFEAGYIFGLTSTGTLCFEELDYIFSFWGLKASPVAWTSLHGGLRINKLQFLIKILDPDPH